jgi:hypothetical protein
MGQRPSGWTAVGAQRPPRAEGLWAWGDAQVGCFGRATIPGVVAVCELRCDEGGTWTAGPPSVALGRFVTTELTVRCVRERVAVCACTRACVMLWRGDSLQVAHDADAATFEAAVDAYRDSILTRTGGGERGCHHSVVRSSSP